VSWFPHTPSSLRRPQNGTQALDRSRELEFVRPAPVGATPFWGFKPPSGEQEMKTKCEPLT
jgi:hypothetical protein